jgi:hypothetical protein
MKKPLIGSASSALQMIRERRAATALIFATAGIPFADLAAGHMPASDYQINRLAFEDRQHLRQKLLIVLHVGIHDGDIGRAEVARAPLDAGRREARRPIRCRQRTRRSRRLISRIQSAVLSGESSSTKITSQLTVSSTASSNSTSGPILSRSLKVGMTTVNSGPSANARSWASPPAAKSFR